MTRLPAPPLTVLDALLSSLEDAASYNRNDQDRPAAVLWTDKEQQWASLAPVMREVLAHFLTFGPYQIGGRTGPAIWLKCMVARTLPQAGWAEYAIPIIYLPGISRADLRAVEDCPTHLQPLAELQYRGVYWTHTSGRDWTVTGYLTSKDGGLGLDVARDSATLEAVQRSLRQVARTQLPRLLGHRIDREFLDRLLHDDDVRAMLEWLSGPDALHEPQEESWAAFRSIARNKYRLDPEKDGKLTAVERLAGRDGPWSAVWKRYVESPQLYRGIPKLLRQVRGEPTNDLFPVREVWPQDNESDERQVRKRLEELNGSAQQKAIAAVQDLERGHADRRRWVWAKLGEAPMAFVLEQLAAVAAVVATPVAGSTPGELADWYRKDGWRADAAVLQALKSAGEPANFKAVCVAVRSLYAPWLERCAQRFQELVRAAPLPGRTSAETRVVVPGTCLLFADGLRVDVSRALMRRLAEREWQVDEGWRWGAIPTVTATAKPAASPIADAVIGTDSGEEFVPAVAATGKPLSIDRFRQLLAERGIAALSRDETGEPTGMAWTEIGDLDHQGHEEGAKLARRIDEYVQEIGTRVETLLEAGWREIRVVTDHGWLLLPGGLPKVDLPGFLTASRWGRCAVPKPAAVIDFPTVGWFWNADVRIATAPGSAAFYAGLEYAHGGISLQECVVPELAVRCSGKGVSNVTIAAVEWVHMRCRIFLQGTGSGLRVAIRTKMADPASTVAGPKDVGSGDSVSLAVENDEFEGAAAVVVLLDSEDKVVTKKATTVGGES